MKNCGFYCSLVRLGAKNLVRRLLRGGGRSCLSHGEDDASSREYCDYQLLRRDRGLTECINPLFMMLLTDHIRKHHMPCSGRTAYLQMTDDRACRISVFSLIPPDTDKNRISADNFLPG